jgi:hypothetical protein
MTNLKISTTFLQFGAMCDKIYMGKGSLHYKQPPSEVPLPKSVALAGGCLL